MRFEVVVVGASIAGCTAAVLLARSGLSVALVERSDDPGAHKRLCTHYIQSCASPAIERIGLGDAIRAAGGVPNAIDLRTPWGWIREPRPSAGMPQHGWNIRRSVLDPALRDLAARTPGVSLFPGHAVERVLRDGDRVAGVVAGGRPFLGRAVVAADGRHSETARLAGIPGRLTPNNRFMVLAHYRDLPAHEGTRSRMWNLDPDIAYTFPNDDGVTVAVALPPMDRLPEFRADREGAFLRYLAGLPDAPDMRGVRRVGPFTGYVRLPNVARRAAVPGLALVGDAARALDPLWGTGCGFAFTSAEWLADAIGPALASGRDPDAALARYARVHAARVNLHAWHMCDFATGRSRRGIETLLMSAAARDVACARHLLAFTTRNMGFGTFVSPRAVARAAVVNVAHAIGGLRRAA